MTDECNARGQQSADEPVAWRTFDGEGGYDYRTYDMNEDYSKDWDERNPKHKGWVQPLYTRPQPAAWVGLTEEDYPDDGRYCCVNSDFMTGARWAVAKLREKNGGAA